MQNKFNGLNPNWFLYQLEISELFDCWDAGMSANEGVKMDKYVIQPKRQNQANKLTKSDDSLNVDVSSDGFKEQGDIMLKEEVLSNGSLALLQTVKAFINEEFVSKGVAAQVVQQDGSEAFVNVSSCIEYLKHDKCIWPM